MNAITRETIASTLSKLDESRQILRDEAINQISLEACSMAGLQIKPKSYRESINNLYKISGALECAMGLLTSECPDAE